MQDGIAFVITRQLQRESEINSGSDLTETYTMYI